MASSIKWTRQEYEHVAGLIQHMRQEARDVLLLDPQSEGHRDQSIRQLQTAKSWAEHYGMRQEVLRIDTEIEARRG